jgi:hypothetical protein
MTELQALEIIQIELEILKKNPCEFRRGYLNGMLNAFGRAGLLDDSDHNHFFELIS